MKNLNIIPLEQKKISHNCIISVNETKKIVWQAYNWEYILEYK
jgi:hypothetical protein